ncbi:MAG: hypothetical protein M1827_002980 [Pycnora praestabilis]|nr:MAG: hypothetical protein M1827_002980 [Pycnora praestabilis]
MATAEPAARPQDGHSRRRPFSTWMKRLANLKGSSSESNSHGNPSTKRNSTQQSSKSKKANAIKNNPYPESGIAPNSIVASSGNGHTSFSTNPSGRSPNYSSLSHDKQSFRSSSDGLQPPTMSSKSAAPTLSTNPDTVNSDTAQSRAGTTATTGGAMSSDGGGGDSTFSSPAPSVRSLTTTLTTIQSTATPTLLPVGTNFHNQNSAPNTQQFNHSNHPGHNDQNQPPASFSHQFPTSPPPSAIPTHLTPQTGGGHPATYNTATANNLLTDNASILTLASSSKRRRRNSIDTNASVRALAPSSVYGGSKESLPLSILSANVGDPSSNSVVPPTSTSIHQARPAGTERMSVYSSSGVAPALTSERNSFYAGKQGNTGDGGSIRSGLLGHGRNDSITGSIGGMAGPSSPLAGPRDAGGVQGRISRRNSGWGEVSEENSDADKEDEGKVIGVHGKENGN